MRDVTLHTHFIDTSYTLISHMANVLHCHDVEADYLGVLIIFSMGI